MATFDIITDFTAIGLIDGGGLADFQIELNGVITLTDLDFIL